MPDLDSKTIAGLLEKAGTLGVNLSVEKDSLIVKFSKQKKIDPMFVDELRSKKDELLEYLTGLNKEDRGLKVLRCEEKDYYPISRNNLYWVHDEDKEFKDKMFILICLKITGSFRTDVFKKAIAYLIRRHESLRITFHKIGESYYIHVEGAESPQFEVDFRDLRDGNFNEGSADHPLNFPGHLFDLAKGPLILVRLMQTKDDEFVLSIKLHHAIFDGWSIGIFKRDLYLAYFSILEGREPDLPVLDRQVKDFMADANRFESANMEGDRKYWTELFPDLPGPLNIPGTRIRDAPVASRPGIKALVPLPHELTGQLRKIAGKHATSLFIILQSLVKMYLAKISGQHDIVLGIQAFGREEFPGSEEQLGFYSRMLFVRTTLDKDDPLVEVIEKVKRSNDDAQNHKAYTLIDTMSEKIVAKPGMVDSFWKANVDFNDESGFYADDPGARDEPSQGTIQFQHFSPFKTDKIATDIELKFHFFIMEDGGYLELTYDSWMYSAERIGEMISDLFAFAAEATHLAII